MNRIVIAITLWYVFHAFSSSPVVTASDCNWGGHTCTVPRTN